MSVDIPELEGIIIYQVPNLGHPRLEETNGHGITWTRHHITHICLRMSVDIRRLEGIN